MEYGLTLRKKPSSRIDLTQIADLKEVYCEEMAPTSISVGYDSSRQTVLEFTDPEVLTTINQNVAIKKIYKSALVNDYQRDLAGQEFPLHCHLKHTNVVQGYEWSEDEDQYMMLMEFMNKSAYFKDKIDQVTLLEVHLLIACIRTSLLSRMS